jgi:hypothetical protein
MCFAISPKKQRPYKWKIVLYSGNNPEWLKAYEGELLEYVQTVLRWKHVTEFDIIN